MRGFLLDRVEAKVTVLGPATHSEKMGFPSAYVRQIP